MLVYRIASNGYIRDLSGYGAKLNGGRWNREGVPVLYTGSSVALCAWEYWVHLPDVISLRENAFSLATIQLPESSIFRLPVESIPQSWAEQSDLFPVLTDDWITQNTYLVMQVPSFVIEQEWNYLINPLHPFFAEVMLLSVVPFSFDKRAFGKVLLK